MIGAGSIVTRDIPENVLAVGNPCRIVRAIGQRDHEYYDHMESLIDRKNLVGICEEKSKHPKFQ